MIKKSCVLLACYLLLLSLHATAVESVLSFEFGEAGDIGSWGPAHSLKKLGHDEGKMVLQLAGGDPYIFAPPLNLEADSVRFVELDLEAPPNTAVSAYFLTDSDSRWGQNKVFSLGQTSEAGANTLRFDVLRHQHWKGAITGFRLDFDNKTEPKCQIKVDALRFVSREPELRMRSACADRRIVQAGETFEYRVLLRALDNYGLENATATISLPPSLSLLKGSHTTTLQNLPMGKDKILTWTLKATQAGVHTIGFNLAPQDRPAYDYSFEQPVFATLGQASVLENEHLRIEVAHDEIGYGRFSVGTREGGAPLAITDSFGEVVYVDASGREVMQKIFLSELRHADNATFEAAGQIKASDGGHWFAKLRLQVEPGARTAQFQLTLSSDRSRKLLALVAPALYVGENGTGGSKTGAQYPGVEYLGENEPSSDLQDFDPLFADRSIPTPRDVTVPLMSVGTQKGTVGILWDNTAEWLPGRKSMRGWFASPNSRQGQDNHLMALLVPSGRDLTMANTVRATEPLSIEPGDEIKIACRIYVSDDRDSLSALDEWVRNYEIPELEGKKLIDHGIELCRYGLQETMWVPDAPGWIRLKNTAREEQIGAFPHNAFALLLDASLEKNRGVAQVLSDQGLGVAEHLLRGRGNYGGDHQFVFHFGRIPGFLQSAQHGVRSAMSRQTEDGGWPFRPGDERSAELGDVGEIEIGICANAALPILRYARITGDEDAVAASLKALERIAQFDVPRAAQVWEIPVHAPDILAASRAVECFIEGYLITGEQRYLKQAAKWARKGLPFIYLWGNEENAIMPYATIPVLGSTFHHNTWVGRPVQWCGIDHAAALLSLARFDDSYPWRDFAQGVLESATRQLEIDGEFKGLLPDFWLFDPDDGAGPMINPGQLYRALMAFKGAKPYVYTARIEVGGKTIRLSSGSSIDVNKHDENKLQFALSKPFLGKSYLYAAGIENVEQLRVGRTKLPRVTNVDTSAEGWAITESGALYAKIRHKDRIKVELSFISPYQSR